MGSKNKQSGITRQKTNASLRKNVVGEKRTICQVHREIYQLLSGVELPDETRVQVTNRLEEAFLMGKKLNNRLVQYKNNYDEGWWEENKLAGGDLRDFL